MKQSQMYIPTTKDVTNQAVAVSHSYALRAGLIHQTAAGIYSYLPMATKMLQNIEKIVREELDKIGANEVILPLLEPSELWEKTGRWDGYGSELFIVQDRNGRNFALAPTHEEVITDLVKNNLNSYKKYPVNLYQIGTKMRDEARPRFGLLRGREFVMMDGYSFHTSEESLKENYNEYYKAYLRIFERLGLNVKVVQADNGQMAGSESHEFMALAEIGEDTIVYEESAEMAFNIEVSPVYTPEQELSTPLDMEHVHTPQTSKIKDLVEKYQLPIEKTMKSVLYNVDGKPVIALVRGDREANEIKVLKAVDGTDIEFADQEMLDKYQLIEGFIGPVNLETRDQITFVLDNELQYVDNLSTGANQLDYHYFNVNYKRDFSDIQTADLRFIEEGEKMSKTGEAVKFARGIEIGHIFALGKNYTTKLGMEYLTKEQKKSIPTMGCYGIGVSRLLSAVIEQSHDENGIIMPKEVAPFDVHIIALDYAKKEEQREFTDKLANELRNSGKRVLIDDRIERPGVKFAEADLLGLPVQVVVGRKFVDDIVEFKYRNSLEKSELTTTEVIEKLK